MTSEQVIRDINDLQLQQPQISPLWSIKHPKGNWIIYSKKIRSVDREAVCRIAESLSLAKIDPYIWGEFTKEKLFERNSHPPYKKIGLLGVIEESSTSSKNVREFLVKEFSKKYTLDSAPLNYDNFKVSDRFLLIPKNKSAIYTKLWGNPTLIDFALIPEESFSTQHKSGLVEITYFD